MEFRRVKDEAMESFEDDLSLWGGKWESVGLPLGAKVEVVLDHDTSWCSQLITKGFSFPSQDIREEDNKNIQVVVDCYLRELGSAIIQDLTTWVKDQNGLC